MSKTKSKPKVRFGDLRAILRYVPLFRGKRFVIAVDGQILTPNRIVELFVDLAVLQSLNIQVILVHGAGRQIRCLAKSQNVTLTNSNGIGVTDNVTLRVSQEAIAQITNQLLQQATVRNMRAALANVLIAHQAGPNQGWTGEVDRVDEPCLTAFLEEGLLPIIAPIGYDRQGNTLRLNSDSVATKVAIAVGASKILFLTESPFQTISGESVRQLSVEQAREAASGDWPHSKLTHAARACDEGVARVHMIDGRQRDALLAELFSNEGRGTMVFSEPYHEIRTATQADVPAIAAMIRPSIVDEDLLPRTAEDVEAAIEDYSVIEIDDNVVGCVALHSFPNEDAVELACLFVKQNHENHGHGKKLIEYAIERSRELNATRLFALTTSAPTFFQRLGGFVLGRPKDLPKSRREKLRASNRASHVVILDLG